MLTGKEICTFQGAAFDFNACAKGHVPLMRSPRRYVSSKFFDRSASMPQRADAWAEEFIKLAEGKRKVGQRLAVVTFGRQARVERAPSPSDTFQGFQRPIDADASDLAAALDAAGELIPSDHAGRVVVLSDGKATGSDSRASARRRRSRVSCRRVDA